MAFSYEIALGSLVPSDIEDLHEEGYPGSAEPKAGILRGFHISFLVSLCLHGVLAATVIYFVSSEIEPPEELAQRLLSVEFIAQNPLLNLAEESVPETPAESAAADTSEETDISTEEMVEAQAVQRQQDQEVAQLNESENLEPLPVQPLTTGPLFRSESIVLPSAESVQSIISEQRRTDASQFTRYDCNKLEEEKEFNGCAPADNRDYSSVVRNPVYDFHNPAIEVSRSRQTVTTLARQSNGVSEQLALSDLPPGLSGYVLEEIEQGIETYSNNSVRTLDHMNTMVDRSAAGAMARRITTTWVQQRSALLQSRKVENRSERLFRAQCRSYEKYILAPAEFARCLSIGESPFGFTADF